MPPPFMRSTGSILVLRLKHNALALRAGYCRGKALCQSTMAESGGWDVNLRGMPGAEHGGFSVCESAPSARSGNPCSSLCSGFIARLGQSAKRMFSSALGSPRQDQLLHKAKAGLETVVGRGPKGDLGTKADVTSGGGARAPVQRTFTLLQYESFFVAVFL